MTESSERTIFCAGDTNRRSCRTGAVAGKGDSGHFSASLVRRSYRDFWKTVLRLSPDRRLRQVELHGYLRVPEAFGSESRHLQFAGVSPSGRSSADDVGMNVFHPRPHPRRLIDSELLHKWGGTCVSRVRR
jgi:hypothetical protein